MNDLIPTSESLLRIEEVAEILSIGQRTIWRHVATGKLPQPLKISRRCYRWRATEIQAFIDSLSQTKAA